MTTVQRFANFVAMSTITSKLLPVTHTTDGYHFREIIASRQLTPKPCPNFKNQPLLYFFYGRPAFRVAATKQATRLHAFSLISLVLNAEILPSPARIFPFDSGAMYSGVFTSFMHPDMTASNFELAPTLQSAQKIVTLFFGNNRNYYLGKCLPGKVFPILEMEAQCYYTLLQASHQMVADHRKGSVEVQLDNDLMVNETNVRAVIMPQDFLDDDEMIKFLLSLRAKPLPYDCYHAQPADDVQSLMSVAKKYLDDEGLLA